MVESEQKAAWDGLAPPAPALRFQRTHLGRDRAMNKWWKLFSLRFVVLESDAKHQIMTNMKDESKKEAFSKNVILLDQ